MVQACAGVGPGIYYYDPCGHRLARLRGPTDEYGLLLEDAALCAGVDPATLQVLLVSSARFPRVSWKYSGLAYSLVLKHVGIVQQSMYLVATSMGLGGCALGAGDSDLFARAVGTDYYAETSVGEFLLGSVPRGRSAPLEVSSPAPQNRTVPLTRRAGPLVGGRPARSECHGAEAWECVDLLSLRPAHRRRHRMDALQGEEGAGPGRDMIVREGQPIDSLFILLDGVLEVTARAWDRQADPPGVWRGGGKISFVDSRPPTATVTAAADAVVLSIPRAALLEKLEQDHELAARFYLALAMFLSQRLRDTGRRLGYGRSELAPAGTEVEGELGEEVLDNIHMAGHRFDHVLQRLLGP